MNSLILLGADDVAALTTFYARLGVTFKGEGRRHRGAPYRFDLAHVEMHADLVADLRGSLCHGVNEVAASAVLIEELGGTVLQGPLAVGAWRVVAALDPAGNPFGLFDLE